MSRRCRATAAAWLVAGLVIVPTPATAQVRKMAAPASATKEPALLSVVPPGATIGGTVEWTITGRNLEGIRRLILSGDGVEVPELKAESATTLKATVRVPPGAEPGDRELRALGPAGISNLVVVRVDGLPQAVEAEPNDSAEAANALGVGTAVAGILTPQDVDWFRFEAKAGARVVIEVESRRLGTPYRPVVTVLTPSGAALAQGRAARGVDHDCRLVFRPPADGAYLVQLHENSYLGADTAVYRLRLDEAPFATGVFPLGGPGGTTITVTASGGLLDAPRTREVPLPEMPGATVSAGAFDGPGGPVPVPMRLIAGAGPEVREAPAEGDGPSRTRLDPGTTANGRLEHPGEVDLYLIPVRKGDKIEARIRAADLGSWLDSVLTLRDDKGATLAENDDPINNQARRNGVLFGLMGGTADSRLVYQAKADGELTLEVADRFGDGGPEYAYRLEVGPARPDFAASLIVVNPALNVRVVNGRTPNPPGSVGAFNLRPGEKKPVNFLIAPEGGFAGKVEVRAEGLPPGVTSKPQAVTINKNGQPSAGALVLEAAQDAEPGLGDLRVVARAEGGDGPALERVASVSVPASLTPPPPPGRPIMRTVASVPVVVIGPAKAD